MNDFVTWSELIQIGFICLNAVSVLVSVLMAFVDFIRFLDDRYNKKK